MKDQKFTRPLKFCPVVGCINSFTSLFSTWLDYIMKTITPNPILHKRLKRTSPTITNLNLLFGEKIFTADATVMCTDIDTTTGVKALTKLLIQHEASIHPSFPKNFFLTTLEIIMKNIIFMFGDTYGHPSCSPILNTHLWIQ
jgi:hypothetical protein